MTRGFEKPAAWNAPTTSCDLLSKNSGENQPATRLGGVRDARGGGDEDVAEKIGKNDVEGQANGQLQHVAAGNLDGSEAIG